MGESNGSENGLGTNILLLEFMMFKPEKHTGQKKSYVMNIFNTFFFMILLWVVVPCFGERQVHAQSTADLSESNYYSVDPVPVPDGVVLEATGLAFDDEGI